MVTLQAVGVTTSTYSSDTALEGDTTVESGTLIESNTVDAEDTVSDEEPFSPVPAGTFATDPTVNNSQPLLFLYDCETTGGNHLRDHIMEVGSVVLVPEGVLITTTEFSSLCFTSQHIVRQGFLFCNCE